MDIEHFDFNEDSLFNNELELLSNNLTNSISLRKIIFDDQKILKLIDAMESSKIIKKIRFYNCYLDDERASIIFSAFKNIKTLENIDLTHNNIKSDSLKILNEALNEMPKLKRLNLYKNMIDDNGLIYISDIIRNSKKLIELNLGNNKFSEKGIVDHLAEALACSVSLEILNLSGNFISSEAIKEISSKLILKKNSTNIKKLNLNRCKIDDNACFYIGDILRSNIKIDELDLNENLISSTGLKHLSEGLRNNHSIKTINFEYNNNVGDLGIFFFTNALRHNKSMRDLFLKNIVYGNHSFENISNCLMDNHSHILNLNLSNNYISHFGIELLSKSLEKNNKLKSISLDYCGLRSSGISMIFDNLLKNKHSQIYFISLEGNFFDNNSAHSLTSLLKENKAIKNLVLKNCKINNDVAKVIFQILDRESEMYVLDLSLNNIKDEAIDELAKSLKENTKLNYLHLNNNELTDSGIVKISESLRENKNFELKIVDIGEMNISQTISDELEEILNDRKEQKELEEIVENQSVKVQIYK